jgi:DNA-binding MarR family transcriptional regulator
MARARGVSRQQVQQQVDRLLELGFVERLPNPAHKRAPLIELTDKGRALIESIRSSERDALSRLQPGVSDEAIADAVRVLQAVQAALERDLEARKAARL